jgi:hypothetical protein
MAMTVATYEKRVPTPSAHSLTGTGSSEQVAF